MKFFLLIATLTFALSAQTKSVLSGRVKDVQGGVVAGARIDLFRHDTGESIGTESNATGEYLFNEVAPGSLVIEVQKEGFRTASLNVTIDRDSSRQLDVTLGLAA